MKMTTDKTKTETNVKLKGSEMRTTSSGVRPDRFFNHLCGAILDNDKPSRTPMSEYVYDSLERMEGGVTTFCKKYPEASEEELLTIGLHLEILLSLPFRLLTNGVKKKDIMKAVSKMCDVDLRTIKMLEEGRNSGFRMRGEN